MFTELSGLFFIRKIMYFKKTWSLLKMLFTDSSPAENCGSTDGAHAQPSCFSSARGIPPPPTHHWILEWLGLEGTLKTLHFQPHAVGRGTFQHTRDFSTRTRILLAFCWAVGLIPDPGTVSLMKDTRCPSPRPHGNSHSSSFPPGISP